VVSEDAPLDEAPVDGTAPDEVPADGVDEAPAAGVDEPDEDDPTVLRFPGERSAPLSADATAPARPSGPLSWAYWSARPR
jgi:hypothetical protein